MSRASDPICPRCMGEGRIPVPGYSINPNTGVRVIDPQCETDTICPACHGDGVVESDWEKNLTADEHAELAPRGFE